MQEARNEKQETRNEKHVTVKKAAPLPSAILFESDAQLGLEKVKSESVALPILKLLQSISGEATKMNQNYIKGAEPGMFLNTVTKKLYDGEKGVIVIPCHYKLEYQEWADYGTGQGRPENIYPDTSDILSKTTQDQTLRDRLPNGNYILTVGQHFVLIVDDNGATETALISMSASQGKVSKKWNSMMLSTTMKGPNGLFTPASFSHMYRLRSVINSGKGKQWYGYSISQIGPVEDPALYERAKQFYQNLANK